jgi:hypothetical protein
LKTSCISHPEREELILIRRWQLEFCNHNACAAALLSYFEYWHNYKLDQRIKNFDAARIAEAHGEHSDTDASLWQFHNEDDLEEGIMLYKRGAIREGIKLLLQTGVIEVSSNPNPKYRFDRTKFFLFKTEVAQKWIDARSMKSPTPSHEKRSRRAEIPPSSPVFDPPITETTSETTSEKVEPIASLFAEGVAPESSRDVVERVWSYYQSKIGKESSTLLPERIRQGVKCFEHLLKQKKDRKRAETCMEIAIDELAASDWHMGRDSKNKGKTANEWKHVFGSLAKLEEWLERSNS